MGFAASGGWEVGILFRQIGTGEIIVILFIALLIFGAKRLPDIGKSLGQSLKEFKGATKGLADDVKTGLQDDATPKAPSNGKPSQGQPDGGGPSGGRSE